MRAIATLALLAFVIPTAGAQTQNQAGFNEFLIYGLGGNATSPVTIQAPLQASGSTISFSCDALAQSPFVLATAAGHLTGWVPVGPNNSVDIDPFTMQFLFDGTGLLIGFNSTTGFWNTGLTGQVSFSIPNLLGLFHDAFQMGYVNSGFVSGVQMSAGFEVLLPVTPFHPCPQVANGAPLSPLSDDGSIDLPIASPGGFTFYGVAYTSVHVNMNGNLTFGAGDSDFTSTEMEMLGGQPRIAVWDDWSPQDVSQGTVDAYEDQIGAMLSVEFFDVRHFGTTACGGGVDTNSFCFCLGLQSGEICIGFGLMELCSGGMAPSYDQIVGISPGGGLSPANDVDLTTPLGNPGAPDLAIYEDFGQAVYGGFDLGAGAPPGNFVVFSVDGGNPAGTTYTQH